jgi:hypothetical protein
MIFMECGGLAAALAADERPRRSQERHNPITSAKEQSCKMI